MKPQTSTTTDSDETTSTYRDHHDELQPNTEQREYQSDSMPRKLDYSDAKTMMEHGSYVLYDHVATSLETALRRSLPQMEVRFSNVSLTAAITVASEATREERTPELPTLDNELKKGIAALTAKKIVVHKEILKNVSGVFKPGTATLILGQPGSGKSALMKILSGRFPVTRNITVEGEISYNGQAQQGLKSRLPQFVAYVNQHDVHYPMLTVKETLEFAHAFSGGEFLRRGDELLANGTSDENRTALEAVKAMFDHYPRLIIEQLGLQNCQDTVVGDEMLRGVSGGERKRVTIGEMEFGMKYVTLMDEVSTGLDSAATFDIINTQCVIAKKFRKTVVIALLQPSPEVFALFDDVMILNEGEVMYHGPREQIVDYFKDMGFVCPPERDFADYLLDLGTKQQEKYFVGSSQSKTKVPRFPTEFAEAFRRSSIHADMLNALNAPYRTELLESVANHIDSVPAFHQSFWESTWTLARKEAMTIARNKAAVTARSMMVILMGIVYATVFYQFNPTKVQVVLGTIFSAVLFIAWGQMAVLHPFVAAREIFYKQRSANFYRTSSYVLSSSLAQLPVVLVETMFFGTLIYWMCGFTSSASSYVIFQVVLLLTNIVFGAWFFFISAISPNINMANPIGNVSVLLFILFAGFIVLKSKIPDYFIWLYWLSPITWGIRAMAINEYRSDTYDVCDYDGVAYCEQFGGKTMGEYYLSLFDIQSGKEWIAYGIIYLVFAYLLVIFLSYLWLECIRYESPENVSVVAKKGVDEDGTMYALSETPKHLPSSLAPFKNEAALPVASPHLAVTPVTVAFRDLWYSVPLPSNPKESIDLLKGITGYALPGTMTALMGSSGAGKTTLMDVIAGRKTGGKAGGKILLNGYAATDLAIRRCTGYCEQMDIHSDSSTIREALTFSAFLRQDSSVPDSQKYDSVTECLDLLDMHDIADQIIRGSSVEQMKRLTIGVELAAQPSVLFLDEPTSGLDARSAKLVMDGVRKVANTGRTIVCTIHQPSSEVFFLFDNLLLLKRGGESVFFGELGENCRNLADYFEAIPGVAPLPTGYNPATWMLECIGAGVSNEAANDMDFVKCFNDSEQKQLLNARIAGSGVGFPAPGSSELVFSQKRAASSKTQMKFVMNRFMAMYWRMSSYSLTRMFTSLTFSLLFGAVFIGADYASYQGVNSGVGMIFLVLVFNGLLSFESIIPIACHERAAYYRERASQTYNAFWYFVGSTLVEIPYAFTSALIFTAIFFPMVGFTGFGTFVLFWINLSLLILYHVYLGQLLAYVCPDEEVASIIGVLIMTIYFAFMGFSPPTNAIPVGYKWVYYLTPLTYSLAIFVALVFSDCPSNTTFDSALGSFVNLGSELGCQPLKNAPIAMDQVTVKQFTEDVFGMKHDEIGMNFAIVVAFTALFPLLTLLSLRFINHQKK